MKRRTALALVLLAAALPAGCSSPPASPTTSTSTSTSTKAASTAATPSVSAPAPSSTSRTPPAAASWAAATRVRVRRVRWRLPAPLSREVVFAQGQAILVAGGLTAGGRTTDQVLSIDPRTGRIGRQARLPQPVHDAAGFMVRGGPLLLGGGNGSELSGVRRRDLSGHWRTVGHLPGSRSDLSAVAVGSGGLAIGGYDGRAASRSVLRTDTGQRFTEVARLVHGVRYAAVARRAGAVWVIGGEAAGAQLSWIQRLDLNSGRVTVTGRWPVRLGHAAAIAVGSRILVLGGRTSAHRVTDAMWWFDPAHGTITAAGRLPYPVADAGLVVTGEAAYLVGGEGPDFRRDVLEVRPQG